MIRFFRRDHKKNTKKKKRILGKKHSRDHAWMKEKKKGNENVTKRGKWKKRFSIFFIISTFTSILGLIVYHPAFYLDTVTVDGLERISSDDFHSTVLNTMEYKRFFVIPGKNYFFVDVNEIRDILKQKYPVASITVQKNFPDVLEVHISEKISTVIYDNGKKYVLLDLDGQVVELLQSVSDLEWEEETKIVTSTDEFGEEITETNIVERIHTPMPDQKIISLDLPIIYDKRHKEININENVLSQDIVSGAIDWYGTFKNVLQAPIDYITIENSLGVIEIHTKEGWSALVSADKAKQQSHIISYLFSEKIDRNLIQYIDVHLENQVFWR